jgi:hypothetical protein
MEPDDRSVSIFIEPVPYWIKEKFICGKLR